MENIEEILAQERQENINYLARQFLNDTDWLTIRHRDQLALGTTPALTQEQYNQLLQYRQQAREQVDNPETVFDLSAARAFVAGLNNNSTTAR